MASKLKLSPTIRGWIRKSQTDSDEAGTSIVGGMKPVVVSLLLSCNCLQLIRAVLPTYHEDAIPSAIAAPEVTKVALRLRYLIEECIPCELEESKITESHSRIITHSVVEAARKAGEVGGQDYNACVVYALLVNKRWFKKQAMLELWDADLHDIRAIACEVIAKILYAYSSFPSLTIGLELTG